MQRFCSGQLMHLDLATILTLHPLSLTVGALCFLYLRYWSNRSRGLGKMAVAFLILAVAALAAGAGEQGVVDYGTWAFVTAIAAPMAYALMYVGLWNVVTERPAGRIWWVMVIPALIAVAAVATHFPLIRSIRATLFLLSLGGFSTASALLVLRHQRTQQLESRYGLAAAFAFKALIGFATVAGVVNPGAVRLTPAATFLVLILCQFAVAMLVLILVQERAERRLIAVTETDSLTGIRNRHWLMDRVPRQVPADSGILVIDIDHFKRINDVHGHPVGDLVLKQVAQTMAATLSEGALLARTGGEEFGLYLPRTSELEAVATGEMLRKAVEELSLVHEGVTLKVTLCVGVAVASEVMSSKGLVARADEALYVAKRAGRNRVRLHDARATASPEAGMAAATAGWGI
jgi:diguanylate cyclase (GGDEF)-like protein